MKPLLERCGNRLLRLSFARLLGVVILTAISFADLVSSGLWYLLYGIYGAPVVIVTTATAAIVATPIGAFLVFLIKKLDHSQQDLAARHREIRAHREQLAKLIRSLRLERNRARAADRTKSEFLAHMSHELRTPLNAIIGFSEASMRQLWGPIGDRRYLEYAADIHRSGQHLLAVINEILDLSKVEAGNLEVEERKVDVGALMADCARLLGLRAQEADVSLQIDHGRAGLEVRADPVRLKQIVLNILSNAVKFTPGGGRVTMGAALDQGGDALITVTDTGIGMAPDAIPKALEPFQQLSDVLTKQEGTGLGLPLATALVKLHQGRLELESRLGQGTRVTIRLPATRVISFKQPQSAAVTR